MSAGSRAPTGDPIAEPASWLRPAWSHPAVRALMSSREGGVSAAPFDSLNLRFGIGDADAAVMHNQARLQAAIGAVPVWLDQVHGCEVVQLQPADALPGAAVHRADASISRLPGLACVVQVADCLPVLMSARGRAVAAAHAGWRGLAAGVIEATVEALCASAGCAAHEVEAWLGPCIGPRRFEVGADVLQAFGVEPARPAPAVVGAASRHFVRGADLQSGKWLADLAGLAQDRLHAAGVGAVRCAGQCTFEQASAFFSFRRDGPTGRMAAAIWLDEPFRR